MNKKLSNNYVFASSLSIGIFLLVYTSYRAFSLSFTHDESISYYNVIHYSFYEIISNDMQFVTANNHILNSLCMKFSASIFGSSEFSLRIHLVIGHVIFLIFTYLLLKNIPSKMFRITGFLFINFNPFLLDFFSLARGYGLAIALMVMSIYYFIEFTKNNSHTYINLCLVFSLLATLSNFSMITFVLSIIIIYECVIILKKYTLKELAKKNIPIILTLSFMFILYNWPIQKLIANNQLYFGGNNGFWGETVSSSIWYYLYETPYATFFEHFIKVIVISVFIGNLLLLYKKIISKTIYGLDYVFIIMILILSINYAQHLIMNTNLYSERVAVFLVVLFIITFINVVAYFWKDNIISKIAIGAHLLIMFTIILVTMKDSFNTNYTYSWRYNADVNNMLNDLNEIQKNENNQSIKLGITWLFEPSINFYRNTKKINWLNEVNRDGYSGDFDFYYIDKNDLNSFDKTNKILIKSYSISGTSLFKKLN